MRRTLGFIVGAVGVLFLAVSVLSPSLPGDAARMAEIADTGSASSSSARQIIFAAGLVLVAIASVFLRR